MVRLAATISRLAKCKVMVIGDLMLDTYTIGKARRISPEAPVAIIQVSREENRAGGAGNVALNLISLGADVIVIGRIGDDLIGEQLKKVFTDEKVDTTGIFVEPKFVTPLKNRVIAENQQIVRIDYEEVIPLSTELESEIIAALPNLLKNVSAVAISDYGKGFLSDALLSTIMQQAAIFDIPVITDPKGNNFNKYNGTTILKPNLSEALAAAGVSSELNLDEAAEKILGVANARLLMITRSEAGISVFQRGNKRIDFPVKVREIKDVTGAGDTVLAMLTCATANGFSIEEAAQLSNVAAGIAIERFGCARVTLSDLARRLLQNDVANKVFDEEHLFALKEALRGCHYTLLGFSGSNGMTSSILSNIHKLSKQYDRDLIVYLTDTQPNTDFVELLTTLHDIKFIILRSDNLNNLCNVIQPTDVFLLDEENALLKLSSVLDLLQSSSPKEKSCKIL